MLNIRNTQFVLVKKLSSNCINNNYEMLSYLYELISTFKKVIKDKEGVFNLNHPTPRINFLSSGYKQTEVKIQTVLGRKKNRYSLSSNQTHPSFICSLMIFTMNHNNNISLPLYHIPSFLLPNLLLAEAV